MRFYGLYDIVALGHLSGRKVSGSFGYGWFLCHEILNSRANIRFWSVGERVVGDGVKVYILCYGSTKVCH